VKHSLESMFPGQPGPTRSRQRFPRRGKLLLALVVCLAVLAVALLAPGGLLALPAPRLVAGGRSGAALIGARGPVTLEFSEPVQRSSAENAFSVEPPVQGRFTWSGSGDQVLSFWPSRPLIQSERFTVQLKSGVRAKSGRELRKAQSWVIEIRAADVLYLSPSQSPEIWRVSTDGKSRVQLTTTGGRVYDASVSPDGDLIAYSVKNDQQGYDVWEVDREGQKPHLLLPCGTDRCTGTTYSPDGTRIAYSRRKNSGLPGRQPGAPQIWLLDRSSLVTGTLTADPNVGGSQADWSPDGRYLAFYDPAVSGVRIQDLQTQASFWMPAEEGSGVEWAPDSRHVYYTQVIVTSDLPENSVYEVDVQTRQTRQVLGVSIEPADYSVPALTPDGEWAAVGWRLAGGSSNKQIWLAHLSDLGNNERRAITSDEAYTQASYHWDPGGVLLVFQRLATGGANSPPQIVVWNRQDGGTTLLAEDAFQPQWLP
jgi:Tol biopolymer transport system component